MVIINADDFGMSSNVNQAIGIAFEQNLITSATIMANMPGFDEACAIIHANRLHGRIGLHMTLTEGPPLTDPIRLCPRLCDSSGQLAGRHGSIWRLSPDEARGIEIELTAQIDAVLANGVLPSHFDSHEHFHTQWAVGTIVMRLAHRFNVPAIRLTRNCIPATGSLRRMYKMTFNTRLAFAGYAGTAHFGSAMEAASLTRFLGPVEIMTHPALDSEGRVIDITSGAGRLVDVAERWTTVGTLTNYSDLYAS